MAKSKMNKDFMKKLLFGIIIIVALHILQTLFYKFIGFDLWDILKVKKEGFQQVDEMYMNDEMLVYKIMKERNEENNN